MTLRCLGERDLTGTYRENPYLLAPSAVMLSYQPLMEPDLAQGWMAPSARVSSLLAITRSASISRLLPRPVQSGQAPCGLLKLKVRGAISPRLIPQLTPAKCSEKSNSPPSAIETSTTPAPCSQADP